jgi:hypothetical protein
MHFLDLDTAESFCFLYLWEEGLVGEGERGLNRKENAEHNFG